MPQVSMRCSISCGMIGSRLKRPLVSFVFNKYRFIDDARVGKVCLGLGKLLHRCCKEKNMKTQLLFMTSLQSPTLWRGLTFGGHIDRYFLGLPYTFKGI